MSDEIPTHPADSPQQRFSRIVEDGLCMSCGLCESVAGAARVRMAVQPDGRERPVAVGPLDDETTERIYATCPGVTVRGVPPDAADAPCDDVWGPCHRVVEAHAAHPAVRFRSASGGVLTALALHLLDSGQVDCILHAAPSATRAIGGEAHISETRDDVLAGMGSRYGPTAMLTQLEAVLARGRPFAFVGKPCDVSGLRNVARHDPRVAQSCRIVLSLICGGYIDPPALRAFLAKHGLREAELRLLRYRGHGNPGPTRLETRDGRTLELSYDALWAGDEESWPLPARCKICPDGIGEAADIVAADAWPGGMPVGEDAGFNAVLLRSAAGVRLWEEACAAGAVVEDAPLTVRDLDDYQPHQVVRKRRAWARHAGLRALGLLAPQTRHLRLAALARQEGAAINLAQARGTRRRAHAGRVTEAPPRLTATDDTDTR